MGRRCIQKGSGSAPLRLPKGRAGVRGVKFATAFDAFYWAQGVLVSFRNGKAFDPNPELFRGGTGGISLKTLIAIDIDHIAVKACRNGHPRPYHNEDCMMDWYLPEPTVRQRERSASHVHRIEDCLWQFETFLRMRGYLD